jgi:hypothetical protein
MLNGGGEMKLLAVKKIRALSRQLYWFEIVPGGNAFQGRKYRTFTEKGGLT